MVSTTTDRLAGVTASLASKAPVRMASTGNLTLSGLQTIDSIVGAEDDRVLAKDQTDGIENGLYRMKSGAWVRSPDFDGTRDVVTGTFVVVAEGTAGAGTLWRISTTGDITIGTTSIAFALMTVDSASAFMLTLLDDGDAATARATLGAQADLDVPSQAEAEAGTATTERVWTAQRVKQASGMSRSYLAGLTLSNGTDATNDIDIAVGEARSDANDADLMVASAIGKQIDVSWAAGGTTGTPTGGLSSSLTLTNDTWYHVILGLVSGTEEIGFDTSITGANLVTDHSFANTRRIGSVRRGTATNLAFTQTGDRFLLADPPLDVDVTNLSTTAVLYTLTVPGGIKVEAVINAMCVDAGATIYVSSLDANDETPSTSAGPLGSFRSLSAISTHATMTVLTNTSSQIRARAEAATDNFRIATLGWVDRRGRDD